VIHRRHEHQEASRHRDVGREPRAFRAERFLDDLDEDLLPFFQQIFDLGLRAVTIAVAVAPAAVAGAFRTLGRLGAALRDRSLGRTRQHRRFRTNHRLVLVAGFETVELFDRVDDFRYVEKRIALEAYVNERGLHAGQNFRDPPLVDVPDHTALPLALDENLDDLILLEDRDACVVIAGGDDHLLVHWNSRQSWNAARGARMRARRPGRRPIPPASTHTARTTAAFESLIPDR
jgi:hypothetical protein